MSDLLMCTIPIFYNLNAYLRFLAPKSRPFSSSQRPENFFWGYSGAFSPPAGFQYTANSFELRAVVSYSIDSRLKFFKKRMVENLNTYFITFMAKTACPQTLLRHHTIYIHNPCIWIEINNLTLIWPLFNIWVLKNKFSASFITFHLQLIFPSYFVWMVNLNIF